LLSFRIFDEVWPSTAFPVAGLPQLSRVLEPMRSFFKKFGKITARLQQITENANHFHPG
jgi:hypothetical protein